MTNGMLAQSLDLKQARYLQTPLRIASDLTKTPPSPIFRPRKRLATLNHGIEGFTAQL
jgi:hypothetical protein